MDQQARPEAWLAGHFATTSGLHSSPVTAELSRVTGRATGKGEPSWKNQLVQVGMLGSFEVRTDDAIVADVPGARLRFGADSVRSNRSSRSVTTRLLSCEAKRLRSAINCRFSRPVSSSSTAANWPVTPIAARTALVSVATSWPATRTVPPSAFINVVSTLIAVVLPAPFGPSRAKIVPAATSRSMPSRTTLSLYAFRSPEAAIAELICEAFCQVAWWGARPECSGRAPPVLAGVGPGERVVGDARSD